MKTLLHFLSSLFHHPAPAIAANDAEEADIIAINETTYDVTEDGVMIVPFGEVPVTGTVNGRAMRVLQRIDAAAANALVEDIKEPLKSPNTKGGILAHIGAWAVRKTGRPIFWGHPDHPSESVASRYTDTRVRGFVKSIVAANEESSIKLVPSYNRLGSEEVKDEQVFGHSPLWRMAPVIAANGQQEVKDGLPVFRPYSLQSVGFTNKPNIPGSIFSANEEEQGISMDLNKLVSALRDASIIKEGDDESAILSAIGNIARDLQWARDAKAREERELALLREKVSAEGANELPREALLETLLKQSEAHAANETELTAANEAQASKLSALRSSLSASRAAHVNAALKPLIATNKIPGSQIETLRAELISAANEEDIDTRILELSRTKPRLGTTGGVTDDLKTGAMKLVMAANDASSRSKQRNEAVSDCLQEITQGHKAKPGDQEKAWNLAQSRNPDLFKH